jgi:hypothetical protein
MDISALMTLALGAAWASGLNLYAAAATLGILGVTGQIDLPPDMQVLTHPAMIGVAAALYCVEFFTDKLPGIDSTWDAIHTFIRIPAGAVMAAMAIGEVGFGAQALAFLLGGGVAAATHAVKAGSRVVINTSPEPFSNWGASITEDALAIGGITLAVFYPVGFLVLFAGFVAFAMWILPKIIRGIRGLWQRLRGTKQIAPPTGGTPRSDDGRFSLQPGKDAPPK